MTAPATPDALPLIRDVLARLCPDDVPVADRGRFETAVFAVTADIVEHASARRARVTLDVTLRCGRGGLSAEIDENGEARRDTADLPAAEIADEVRYDRRGGRNRWLITCALTRRA